MTAHRNPGPPVNDSDAIRALLSVRRRIAVVGASTNPARDSNRVLGFLVAQGHDVIAVNPAYAGQSIHGAPVVAALDEIDPPAEMVDIFRNSADAGDVVDAAIAHGAEAVWMQLGVINPDAAERARAAGLTAVMDRCPKIEIPRLGLLK